MFACLLLHIGGIWSLIQCKWNTNLWCKIQVKYEWDWRVVRVVGCWLSFDSYWVSRSGCMVCFQDQGWDAEVIITAEGRQLVLQLQRNKWVLALTFSQSGSCCTLVSWALNYHKQLPQSCLEQESDWLDLHDNVMDLGECKRSALMWDSEGRSSISA